MQSSALPWQRPGLLGVVLGNQPLLPMPMAHLGQTAFAQGQVSQEPKQATDQEVKDEEDSLSTKEATTKPRARLALTAKAAPKKKLKAYKDQDQAQRRAKLLDGWKELVQKAPRASQTGELMASPDEWPEEVLRLTLIDKATNTLAARLSSVAAYVAWMPSEEHWPPTEKFAYDFVAQTANVSAPATRATRFLEALGFMQGAFGFNFETILASRRLSGFCA